MIDISISGRILTISEHETEPRVFIDAKPVYRFKADAEQTLEFAVEGYNYKIPFVSLSIGGAAPDDKADAITKLAELFPDANTGSGGTGSEVIHVTKSQLDNLIAAAELQTGKTYHITGTQANSGLYLELFLKAVTTSEISKEGCGLFYNPDYEAKGNYSNIILVAEFGNLINPSTNGNIPEEGLAGDIYFDETTGKFRVMTLDYDAENIDSTYASDVNLGIWYEDLQQVLVKNNVVIWNGLHYLVTSPADFGSNPPDVNNDAYYPLDILGSINNSPDFSTIGYRKVIDLIKYDYENDFLMYREDNYGNKISDNIEGSGSSPFYNFQWGNVQRVSGNKINEGLIKCLNNRGNIYDCYVEADSELDATNNEGILYYVNILQASEFNCTTNGGVFNYITVINSQSLTKNLSTDEIIEYKIYDGRPLIYNCQLFQTSTGNPFDNILGTHTFSGNITWTRVSENVYNGYLAGAFPANKTSFKYSSLQENGDKIFVSRLDDDNIKVTKQTGYKSCDGKVTLNGNSAPTLSILTNQLGASFTTSRQSNGLYFFTADSSVFSDERTNLFIQSYLNKNISIALYAFNTFEITSGIIDPDTGDVVPFDITTDPIAVKIENYNLPDGLEAFDLTIEVYYENSYND